MKSLVSKHLEDCIKCIPQLLGNYQMFTISQLIHCNKNGEDKIWTIHRTQIPFKKYKNHAASHLPLALLCPLLQMDVPVLWTDVCTVRDGQREGSSDEHIRGPTGDFRTQEYLRSIWLQASERRKHKTKNEGSWMRTQLQMGRFCKHSEIPL